MQHLVYSSLDGAAGLTDGQTLVPHYDAKAAVEQWIDMMRADEFMTKAADGFYSSHVTVLVTGPYFENLQTIFAPRKGPLSDGREGLIFEMATGGLPHPMIALDDIAWFARHIFDHPDRW